MRDAKERLRDILQAIEAIERYLGRGKEAFEHDELLQVWVIRHLEIIGEAVRALPEEIRRLEPEVPWTSIIGMRNILVHGYFDVDTDIVWETATRDMPALKPAIERLLHILEEGPQ